MTEFTTDELRSRTDDVLAAASRDGAARVRTAAGEEFTIRPAARARSPLDVGSLDLGLTADEIVAFVREGRERDIYPADGVTSRPRAGDGSE